VPTSKEERGGVGRGGMGRVEEGGMNGDRMGEYASLALEGMDATDYNYNYRNTNTYQSKNITRQ